MSRRQSSVSFTLQAGGTNGEAGEEALEVGLAHLEREVPDKGGVGRCSREGNLSPRRPVAVEAAFHPVTESTCESVRVSGRARERGREEVLGLTSVASHAARKVRSTESSRTIRVSGG